MCLGLDVGVGVGVVVSVWVFRTILNFPSQVRNYLPQICISHIIFKSRKSFQFGYALVASFSKQDNHANLGMR